MIVISAGMQKAGTAWFNLTNDLLSCAGHQDIRSVRDRFELGDILLHHNCNIGVLSFSKFRRLEVLHHAGFTFAVKTHAGPTDAMKELIRSGIVKVTYIYRDPRGVAVSAFEHGERLRALGRMDTFAELHNIDDAIIFARNLISVWDQYRKLDQILLCRYEDLVSNPKREINKLADFLELKVASSQLDEIIKKYSQDRVLNNNKMLQFLHFNKAVPGRFKQYLPSEKLVIYNQYFGDLLQQMGYSE